MKRIMRAFALALTVCFCLTVLSGCGGGPASKDSGSGDNDSQHINIGTGGTEGTYYPLGIAIAEIFENNIDGVSATADATGASVANISLMREGLLNTCIIQNDVAYYAKEGVELFDESYDELMGLACLYSEPVQCVTTDESIKSIADLKGRRVALGAFGSGGYSNTKKILTAAGLKESDLSDMQNLNFAEAASSLKNGEIDAAFIVAGTPTAAIEKLSEQQDIFLVPIDGEIAENLMSDYDFYTEHLIPAGTYDGQDEDISTVTVRSMLAASSTLSDELVYGMMESIFANLPQIADAHPVGADISEDSATTGMSIEMHPGAEDYFNR